MSGFLTDKAVALWNGLKSIFSGVESKAEDKLHDIEADFLPKFHALTQTSISTLKGQAYDILKDELATVSTAFVSGGDVAAAISASVPKVLAEVALDVTTDLVAAKNAIYTLIGLELASLTSKSEATPVAADPAIAAPVTA